MFQATHLVHFHFYCPCCFTFCHSWMITHKFAKLFVTRISKFSPPYLQILDQVPSAVGWICGCTWAYGGPIGLCHFYLRDLSIHTFGIVGVLEPVRRGYWRKTVLLSAWSRELQNWVQTELHIGCHSETEIFVCLLNMWNCVRRCPKPCSSLKQYFWPKKSESISLNLCDFTEASFYDFYPDHRLMGQNYLGNTF